jgi:alpha-amylase
MKRIQISFLSRLIGLIVVLIASTLLTSGVACASERNEWWKKSVIYEIFVRSFQDSNGDGIGDLNGVRQRLDELHTLGVDAIWLTPIFASPSYHGYDTTNFLAINPDYGTLSDFEQLIADAHAKGIKIILDLAVNHTSIQHAWFTQSKDRYMWNTAPRYNPKHWYKLNNGYYYGTFSRNLPDLNWYSKNVRTDIKNVFLFWAEKGVDGFRLDAARYYAKGPHGESDTSETHKILAELVASTRKKFPDVYFVGEVWADHSIISTYLKPGQLDAAFDFPSSFALVHALQSGRATEWIGSLRDAETKAGSLSGLAPFITNHDMVRAATQLHANQAQLKLAAIAEMVLPGTPYLYYGEEIGMLNAVAKIKATSSRGDEAKRTPMRWTNGQNFGFSSGQPWVDFSDASGGQSVQDAVSKDDSLWHVYQTFIQLRHHEPTLTLGSFKIASPAASIAVLNRSLHGETSTVVFNFSNQDQADVKISFPKSVTFTNTLWGDARTQCTGNVCVVNGLKAVSAQIFKTRTR